MIKPPLKPLLDNEVDLDNRIRRLRELMFTKRVEANELSNDIDLLEKELVDVQAVIASYFKHKE